MRSRTPKVLHRLCGRPMIDWVLDAVREAGADAITVVVNPHHAEVAAHLDGRAEVVYQREPNGTAHALQQVEGLTGDVLVVNGDSPLLTAGTIQRLVDSHRQATRPATLASVEDASRDDGRIVRGKDGEVDRIVERKDASAELKKTVHEFNVGIYCFDGWRIQARRWASKTAPASRPRQRSCSGASSNESWRRGSPSSTLRPLSSTRR